MLAGSEIVRSRLRRRVLRSAAVFDEGSTFDLIQDRRLPLLCFGTAGITSISPGLSKLGPIGLAEAVLHLFA